MRDVLGYDGVQVNFPSGEKHFIAWFPNQIKHATENSGAFSGSDNRIRYSISDRDSRGRKLTPEQQEFFRGSIIRDDQGRLMVMYHGTRNGGFTVFDGGKDYFYFTNNRRYAYTFEGRKANGQLYPSTREDIEAGLISPQMYEVYLNVTNPFIAEQDVVEDALYWDRSLAQQLRDRGYDALMMEDMSQVIVLSPEQIKNVTNRTPTSNPDIRYSMDEDTAAEPSDNPLPSPDQDETQGTEQSYFDTLPRRVQTYLNRAENRLISRVGDQLNVPRMARREYLKGIARQLTEEYLQQGRVSQETMDRMFDEAYDQGVVVDREFYDEYKDLRDYLRKANLQISQEDASDIQDFNDFRKSNFGRLNISTKSGRTNIDQVYQELSARWPEFFNEQRESAPSDQLVRMAEVAQSFQIAEKSLDDYYGDQAADYRTWAKNDFEAAVTDALASLRNARRYIEGRPAEDTSQAPTTMEEVAQLWENLKEARRLVRKALRSTRPSLSL